MPSNAYYPIIVTEKFSKTVGFFEDHFEFTPIHEKDGYIILQRKGSQTSLLGIMDTNHESIPEEYKKQVSGMILTYPVKDVLAQYQQFYWEGLKIISEPEKGSCAHKHFLLEDPNGVLIDVIQAEEDQDDIDQGPLKINAA